MTPETTTLPTEITEPSRKRLGLAAPAAILLGVLVFYWTPLFSSSTSIQGDTADVHYPLQKYFADRMFSGHLPFWTPYIYSGFPVLSNPLMGAWYPLNWPFFAFGVTPTGLEWQLAIHAALACLGTYFFLRRIVARPGAAVLGAFAYGFSGFFVAQSSHLGIFAAAAWFPWQLLAYRRACEGQKLRFSAVGGVAGGLMLLSGHWQAGCFTFIGLGLYALAEAVTHATPWSRGAGVVITMVVCAILISTVQWLPAWEIAGQLAAPAAAQVTGKTAVLQAEPLKTVVWPDWTGTISNNSKLPDTRPYFYAGMLTLPLALLGLIVSPRRGRALFLILPTLWFMLGPSAGLFRLGAILPPLHSGPPVFAWFLVAFGLAVLAAEGSDWICRRHDLGAIAVVVTTAILFGDLWYWNSSANPLAYARQSFQVRYGDGEAAGRTVVAAPQLPLSRFDSPTTLVGIGPRLHPLDIKFETTYGYLLPESAYYSQYRSAMTRNSRLRDGLNVTRFVDLRAKQFDVNGSALPRTYFPHSVREVNTEAESRRALETLAPSEVSTVLPPHEVIEQDPTAEAFVNSFGEQFYHIHCSNRSPSLLKLSVPWYPGWRATIGPRRLPVLRVDHALMGVVVPPGEHDIEFTFAPRWFYPGAVISLLSSLLVGLVAMGGGIYRRLDRTLFRDSEYHRKRRRVKTVRRSSI